jgi:hypothetical protein
VEALPSEATFFDQLARKVFVSIVRARMCTLVMSFTTITVLSNNIARSSSAPKSAPVITMA